MNNASVAFPPVPAHTSLPAQTDARSWGGQAAQGVAAGAALTLTRQLHAGRTVLQDTAAGSAITLPAALGSGDRYRVAVSVAGNAHTVATSPTTDVLAGGIMINDTGDSAAATADGFPTAATSNKISQTTAGGGGKVGDYMEFVDILAGTWLVSGFFQGATDPTTPFSHV